MKPRVKKLAVTSLITILALVNVACTREHRSAGYRISAISPDTAKVQEYSVWPYMESSPFDVPGSRFTTRVNDQPNDQNSVNIAASIPAVRNATAFIHGNEIIVGLEVSSSVHNMQNIERQVRNALEATLPGFIVHVTANRIMNERIRKTSSQLYNVQGNLSDDIGTLIRDIDGYVPWK